MSGTPMEVAIAMGILVSELTHDAFKHRVLTFESDPHWVDLSGCKNIRDKVSTVQRAPWGGSTNFATACERLLAVAEHAKLTPDAIPDLIVFSDMQFNTAGGYGWETQFERLQRRFAEVGRRVCGEPYGAPRIVFWNLRSSVVFPVSNDTPNTQMISGFSPALLKGSRVRTSSPRRSRSFNRTGPLRSSARDQRLLRPFARPSTTSASMQCDASSLSSTRGRSPATPSTRRTQASCSRTDAVGVAFLARGGEGRCRR